jgi:hypothetical protein
LQKSAIAWKNEGNLRKSSLRLILALIVTAATCPLGIRAQEIWPKKPSTQWSRSEAEAVLNSLPWASRQEIRLKFDKELQAAAGSYSGVSSAAQSQSMTEVTSQMPVDFIFTLRLRSALPIRQAMVRLKTLETDVEKMNPSQLAAFDAQLKGLLECPACADNYVVTLSSKSTNRPGADAAYTAFKGGRLADLQRFVLLANDRGERRQLVYFVAPKAPGDEVTFFFRRLDDQGAPLLTPESKLLIVTLSDNQPSSVSNFRIDVSKLILKGKVEF